MLFLSPALPIQTMSVTQHKPPVLTGLGLDSDLSQPSVASISTDGPAPALSTAQRSVILSLDEQFKTNASPAWPTPRRPAAPVLAAVLQSTPFLSLSFTSLSSLTAIWNSTMVCLTDRLASKSLLVPRVVHQSRTANAEEPRM